ncbi:hypothetical protein [Spirosoma pomorum]
MPKLRITYPEVIFKTIEIDLPDGEIPGFVDRIQEGKVSLIAVGNNSNVIQEAKAGFTVTVVDGETEKTTALLKTLVEAKTE